MNRKESLSNVDIMNDTFEVFTYATKNIHLSCLILQYVPDQW